MTRHTGEGGATHRSGDGALRRRMRAAAALLGLAALLLVAAPGRAVTLLPGEAFEVDFSFSSQPLASGNPVDLLVFGLAPSTTHSGVTGFDVELWDGGTLLATNSTTGPDLLWAFVSAGSAWTQNPEIVSDFSSIVDGSIDGRIRLIPQFGSVPASGPGAFVDVVFFPPPGTGMDAGVALSDGISFVAADPEPLVSATRVVPEPAATLLLAALSAGAMAVRRARRS